uniref:Uncharacterized protein n=1 Tax=Anguilla anguilla TaxID=7936 RepID=A0A0E9S0V7_ANGAN
MLKNINYAINYLEFPDLYIHREVTKKIPGSRPWKYGRDHEIYQLSIRCNSDISLENLTMS